MQVPFSITSQLVSIVTEHYADPAENPTPAEIGRLCGVAVRRWLEVHRGYAVGGPNGETAMVSWGERFGRHLSEFFINERSL
jgi:hypothetical protein